MTVDSLYPIFRIIHSVLRWVVVLTALFAIIRAITGMSFKRTFMDADNRAGMWFTISMDLQLLVGIILYFFLSPTTVMALQNMAATMSIAASRFYAVEHVLIMVLAVIAAHIGRSQHKKKALSAAQKHRRTLIWFVIALLLVLAAIPWPFLSYGRPLLPF